MWHARRLLSSEGRCNGPCLQNPRSGWKVRSVYIPASMHPLPPLHSNQEAECGVACNSGGPSVAGAGLAVQETCSIGNLEGSRKRGSNYRNKKSTKGRRKGNPISGISAVKRREEEVRKIRHILETRQVNGRRRPTATAARRRSHRQLNADGQRQCATH